MTTKPEERFLNSIDEGVPGTSMPAWGKALSDEQIKGVFDYIWQTYVREPQRQLKPRKVPEQNPVRDAAESAAARRSHLHAALHRLPRTQGGWQRTELDGHLAAPAQPAQLPPSSTSAPDRRLFESIITAWKERRCLHGWTTG